ncbi:MAG: hypothetical protein JNK78_19320 [Planctomycetes bacterium]|nr:hypothetical protein [Planctomycetota bacterium]
MTAEPVLAVSGSNLTGDVPFSCALSIGGRIVETASPAGERGDLATLVAAVCAREGLRSADVRRVRIDVGPGSYTGLRVAITFVRSLLHFGGVVVEAIDSLAMLADTAPLQLSGARRIRPVLDARRERLHSAAFRRTAGGVLAVDELPRAVPVAEIVASTKAGDLFVVPANLPVDLQRALSPAGVETAIARGVTAARLFSPGLAFERCTAAQLEPRYLMASYAE